jgi:thioredoxin 1
VSEQIVHTSDNNFENDVLKSDKPVLVDYWAEWCGPCKMIAPILDEIAGDYADKLTIAKLNIDENPQTPPKAPTSPAPTTYMYPRARLDA